MEGIPYYDRIVEELAPLNPQRMTEYKGEDITDVEEIKLDMMTQQLRVFKADKIAKILTLTTEVMGGKIVVYGTTIIPEDNYPLPIFTSEVVFTATHLSLRVDLIPLADLARDEEYLEKYIMPMEDLWKKYKDIEGAGFERYVWQRVQLSPFYTYGKYKYEIENIGEKALDITLEYLNLYTKLWADVQPADPDYMKALNERKIVMLKTMLDNDPGEFWLKQSLDDHTAHKILSLLF
jgi:hypothetical protein